MGERLTEADVMDLIDEIDADGFGTVNKDEFIDLIEKRIKDKDLM
jgi:Ca2+-binding EF-hand superfamily protein